MLRREDNERITRVGPGTPMGELWRRFWVPALLSSELPAPDSDPVRVTLLGEKLIAFRDTTGKVGRGIQTLITMKLVKLSSDLAALVDREAH